MNVLDALTTEPTEEERAAHAADRLRQETDRELHMLRAKDAARRAFEAEQYAERVGKSRGARSMDGAEFIFDYGQGTPALWGDGENVLWMEGEALLIVGDDGVGKTLTAQQLVLSRIGIRERLWDLPVLPAERCVLYLAMDRPAQAARSFYRMVNDDNKDLLRERLIVWRGPLPVDPLGSPSALADWIGETYGGRVTDVVADSLKDLAPNLAEDGPGSRLNSAVQEVTARGMQWVGLHHQRKTGSDGKASIELASVYGSRWITAGSGSVVFLAGKAGQPTIEARHLKQPRRVVGPLLLKHDHETGTTGLVTEQADELQLLMRAGKAGMTAKELSMAVYGEWSDRTRQRVERTLKRLAEDGLAYAQKAARPGLPARWFAGSPE